MERRLSISVSGQYEDAETGLYYNRFRYYSPDEGMYISQDPIRLAGGDNLYGYVRNTNAWIDPLGLKDAPASLPNTSGVYILTNDTLKEQNASSAYVGSSVTMNDRVSGTDHTRAQELLAHPDTKFNMFL